MGGHIRCCVPRGLDRSAVLDAVNLEGTAPCAHTDDLFSLKTLGEIEAFAEKLEIAPAIVVGRLQHEGAWRGTEGGPGSSAGLSYNGTRLVNRSDLTLQDLIIVIIGRAEGVVARC